VGNFVVYIEKAPVIRAPHPWIPHKSFALTDKKGCNEGHGLAYLMMDSISTTC
jgi:hypothetical protein